MARSLRRLLALLVPLVCLEFWLSTSVKTEALTGVPPKLVSLAPSNTELVYCLNKQDYLVGRSSYCHNPKAVESKPVVGSFISANTEKLASLKPDFVLLVNGQEALSSQLQHQGFKTIIFSNNSLADIGVNLKLLGQVTGAMPTASKVNEIFSQSLNDLRQIVKTDKQKPSVFYCVWAQPLISCGSKSFLNDVITACGAENIAGHFKAAYPHVSLELLLYKNPDVLILSHDTKDKSFLKRPPWNSLRAVKNNRVYSLPVEPADNARALQNNSSGESLLRPSPKVIDGLYWLSSCLHPTCQKELERWHQKYSRELAINGLR